VYWTACQLERGLRFGLGSTLAFRRADLEKIGGFRSIVDFLADDYELGRRIANLGLRVVLSTLSSKPIFRLMIFVDSWLTNYVGPGAYETHETGGLHWTGFHLRPDVGASRADRWSSRAVGDGARLGDSAIAIRGGAGRGQIRASRPALAATLVALTHSGSSRSCNLGLRVSRAHGDLAWRIDSN